MCNPRAPGTNQVQSLGNSPKAQVPEQPREGAREEGDGGLNIFEILGKGGGGNLEKTPWLHAWQAGCLAKKWKLAKKHGENQKEQGTQNLQIYNLPSHYRGFFVFFGT